MIEISRDAKWLYRQNKKQPRAIDRKPNKHRARWVLAWQTYTTEEAARRAVVELGKGEEE